VGLTDVAAEPQERRGDRGQSRHSERSRAPASPPSRQASPAAAGRRRASGLAPWLGSDDRVERGITTEQLFFIDHPVDRGRSATNHRIRPLATAPARPAPRSAPGAAPNCGRYPRRRSPGAGQMARTWRGLCADSSGFTVGLATVPTVPASRDSAGAAWQATQHPPSASRQHPPRTCRSNIRGPRVGHLARTSPREFFCSRASVWRRSASVDLPDAIRYGDAERCCIEQRRASCESQSSTGRGIRLHSRRLRC
jgi:hypothetical protein